MTNEQLNILSCYVDFVHGAGPHMGLWASFLQWMKEAGYKEEEIEDATKALGDLIGKEL